jgi:N-methylhydantoinase B
MSESDSKCRVAIDIGGTFTDLVLYRDGKGLALTKVPSTPSDYSRGVLESDGRLTLHFDRALTPQWGLFGGGDGARPRVTVFPSDGKEPLEILKAEQLPLAGGSRFVCETGGGGGYGDPLERDPEDVRRDFLDGYVSREAALEDYGVVVDERGELDVEKTARRRARVSG